MKKLALLFVSMYIGTALFYGQTGQTAEGLKKAKAKSDEEIQDAKKNIKSSTWEKRGDLFLDIAQFNTKGLFMGMTKTGITGAELIKGKPKDIKKVDGTSEDWIYETGITLHFVGDTLENWEETVPLDPQAVDKAIEAYDKAIELDQKGKLKNKETMKINISQVRNLYREKGAKNYQNSQFADAFKNLEKSVILYDYPRIKADTLFNIGIIALYTGLAAEQAKDYDNAKKYFNICIDKGYVETDAYVALAHLYAELNEKDKQKQTLEKGFEKYPNSKELQGVYINYCIATNQFDEALKKIETSLKDDPKNSNLLHVKAAIYDKLANDTSIKISNEDRLTYLNKAIDNYKEAIVIKADFFDSNFNLGAIYFNNALLKLKEADKINVRDKEKYEAKVAEVNQEFAKSLPYFEKAHEINPTDRQTLKSLITIYLRIQKYDKKKEMQDKLDKLPEEKSGL
jgi:tetratricopeptide (TPR) repeat protein